MKFMTAGIPLPSEIELPNTRYWTHPPDADARMRLAARTAVKDAIRKGLMVRGQCEQLSADCDGPIEGHHDDHTKQLEVRWLCRKHHRRLPK